MTSATPSLRDADAVWLAANENPLGFSQEVRAVITSMIDGSSRYPDASGHLLKRAIGNRYGLPLECVTLGNGSNDILDLAARALVTPGDSIVYSQYSFIAFRLVAQAVGARIIVAPSRDFHHDLDAMAAVVEPNTRIVFVANPNNPTGTFVRGEQLEAFVARIPSSVVVVLDLAYDEYLSAHERYDSASWLRSHDNLLICRTFSKAYGLAGLRIGFALAGKELSKLLDRVRQPFNTNAVAQAAALAAIANDDHVALTRELNARERARIKGAFDERGWEYIESRASFVMASLGNGEVLAGRLADNGVFVRALADYGLRDWVRISIGLESENTRLLEAMDAIASSTSITRHVCFSSR